MQTLWTKPTCRPFGLGGPGGSGWALLESLGEFAFDGLARHGDPPVHRYQQRSTRTMSAWVLKLALEITKGVAVCNTTHVKPGVSRYRVADEPHGPVAQGHIHSSSMLAAGKGEVSVLRAKSRNEGSSCRE